MRETDVPAMDTGIPDLYNECYAPLGVNTLKGGHYQKIII